MEQARQGRDLEQVVEWAEDKARDADKAKAEWAVRMRLVRAEAVSARTAMQLSPILLDNHAMQETVLNVARK